MAPSAMPEHFDRNGQELEAMSDYIDEVNVLKANMKAEMLEKSQFDTDKDKTKFRQYEDACDHVKTFYREQHEKQTVAYNLKARNTMKFKTRAHMTVWEAIEK